MLMVVGLFGKAHKTQQQLVDVSLAREMAYHPSASIQLRRSSI